MRWPLLRAAGRLCELADTLVAARPRDWEARARRAYTRVARTLAPLGLAAPAPAVAPDASTLARALAHRTLAAARRPLWRLAAAGGAVVAVLAGAVVGATLALAAVSPRVRAAVFPPNVAAHANWTASTALPGYDTHGGRPSARPGAPAFFHTNGDDHPWVRIELPAPTRLRSIRIDNRTDCCELRGLPLNVEVHDDPGWRLLCQRRTPFVTWTCRFPATTVDTFRLIVAGAGYFHLKRVAAFP